MLESIRHKSDGKLIFPESTWKTNMAQASPRLCSSGLILSKSHLKAYMVQALRNYDIHFFGDVPNEYLFYRFYAICVTGIV